MSHRERRSPHSSHDRWLVSYADFITLLFAFFVVLYSSAQVDKRRVGKLAMAIQVAFQELGVFQASTAHGPVDSQEPMPLSSVPAIENVKRTSAVANVAPVSVANADGEGFPEATELRQELEQVLANEIAEQKIALRLEPNGLVISLKEVGFFESGSAEIKPESQSAFDRIASILRDRNYRLRIEGHTDDVPIHTAQYASNWELSTARATELVRMLIVRNGFPPSNLCAGGFAEFHPVASNRSAEGRAQNRRVDVVILGKGASASVGSKTAMVGSPTP